MPKVQDVSVHCAMGNTVGWTALAEPQLLAMRGRPYAELISSMGRKLTLGQYPQWVESGHRRAYSQAHEEPHAFPCGWRLARSRKLLS
jgi:hypothetical protein